MIFNYCYIFCAHVAIHQDNMVDARSPPPDEHGALHEMETEAPREARASTWALILGLNLSICLYIICFGISSSYSQALLQPLVPRPVPFNALYLLSCLKIDVIINFISDQ